LRYERSWTHRFSGRTPACDAPHSQDGVARRHGLAGLVRQCHRRKQPICAERFVSADFLFPKWKSQDCQITGCGDQRQDVEALLDQAGSPHPLWRRGCPWTIRHQVVGTISPGCAPHRACREPIPRTVRYHAPSGRRNLFLTGSSRAGGSECHDTYPTLQSYA
jgi:hypothetical protein